MRPRSRAPSVTVYKVATLPSGLIELRLLYKHVEPERVKGRVLIFRCLRDRCRGGRKHDGRIRRASASHLSRVTTRSNICSMSPALGPGISYS